ncbi:MAG: hypothetical protein GWN64_07760 [Candidatus Thorarchaeota archaeon]|nr:hypothetical protein [Candidatus Thorarchaeota archaeon]
MAKEKTTTPEQDFSFLNAEDQAKGFEQIGMGEQAIPFLRLAQELSPQVKESKPEYIEGLKPGMIFNSVTKEIYEEGLEIVSGGFEHVYIEWPPERGSAAPLAYHAADMIDKVAADKSKFGDWRTKDGNKLEENYLYYCLVVGKEGEGICVLPMKSTSIKVAKQWNRQLLNKVLPNGQKAMPYYLTWTVKGAPESKGGNDYWQWKVDWKGYVTKDLYEAVSTERKSLPTVSSLDFKQLSGPDGSVESEKSDSEVQY